MKRLLIFLICTASLYGQGVPVRYLSGSGAPSGGVASVEGTHYVDNSVNPAVTYICTSVSIAAGPSPPAGTQTCNWTQIGGGGSSSPPNAPLPIATSGPGPVFNVANYTGAFHNTRQALSCTPTTVLTCTAAANFTTADLGKRINCGLNGQPNQLALGTTITGITSTSIVTLSAVPVAGNVCTATLGTPDDTAIASALAAALAQSTATSGQGAGNGQVPTAAPVLYFPAGGWMACGAGPILNFNVSKKGFKVKGDGYDVTWLYNCDNPPTMGQFGYWISNTNMTNLFVEDLTFSGGYVPISTGGFGYGIYATQGMTLRNVHMTQGGYSGGAWLSGGIFALNFVVDLQNGNAIYCNACGGEFREWSASNSTHNLIVQNVVGLNTGQGVKFFGGLVDEGGTIPVTQIQNSTDVWFLGTSGFGTGAAYAMSVDATSFVHLIDGIWGVFGNDGNAGGISIAAGGVVQASDTRFVSSGTRACIANSGTFNDNGGNSCESMFQIVSGTSTGTTAVLTLTPASANVNTNCTVGDALVVQGANPIGYNGYFPAGATSGITATSATTLTYTTIGSNLGAAGAGGTAFCRNLQGYTGNLPRALLNNPIPNTCYVTITPIVNATTYLLCNFRTQSATNITRIMASSQVVTTCATAPIITISDGTATQTLTLTTAKQSWDSSVDASTGVGTTIFKPNGTITVKYDVGAASACATPPTQLAISYNISPILSN